MIHQEICGECIQFVGFPCALKILPQSATWSEFGHQESDVIVKCANIPFQSLMTDRIHVSSIHASLDETRIEVGVNYWQGVGRPA